MAGTAKIDTIQSELSTPTVFKNSSGTEIGRFCRAWVNLTGTSPYNVRASFNFSSVAKQAGGGDFIYTMTTAMPDANYAMAGCAGAGADGAQTGTVAPWNVDPTASAFRSGCVYDGVTSYDNKWVTFMVTR